MGNTFSKGHGKPSQKSDNKRPKTWADHKHHEEKRLALFEALNEAPNERIVSALHNYIIYECPSENLDAIHKILSRSLGDDTTPLHRRYNKAQVPIYLTLRVCLSSIENGALLDVTPIVMSYITGGFLPGLVGYWLLDGSTDGFQDISDSNMEDARPNARLKRSLDETKGYLQFGGSGNVPELTIPRHSSLDVERTTNNISIAIWVNRTGESDGPLVDYRSGHWMVHLWMHSGAYMSRMSGGSFPDAAGSNDKSVKADSKDKNVRDTIPLNEWHFVCVTYDGNNNDMYVDGYLRSRVRIGSVRLGTAASIHVGNRDGRILNAQVKGLQIYDRPLTQDEIRHIMEYDRPKQVAKSK